MIQATLPRAAVRMVRSVWRTAWDQSVYRWRQLTERERVNFDGVYLTIDRSVMSDTIISRLHRRKYERAERAIMEAVVEPDDIILELGGGIGYISTVCSLRVHSAEQVWVFEANPRLLSLIRRNHALNGVEPHAINSVLGRGSGTTDFYVTPDFWTSSTISATEAKRITVPLQDFNDTVRSIEPSFLVIDIEGGEVELFGFADIPMVRKLCVELHPHRVGAQQASEVVAAVIEQGFAMNFSLSHGKTLYFEREP